MCGGMCLCVDVHGCVPACMGVGCAQTGVCMGMHVYGHVHVCVHLCVGVHVGVSMCVWMYVCTGGCASVCGCGVCTVQGCVGVGVHMPDGGQEPQVPSYCSFWPH